jgi:hypothetical protein
MGYILQEQEQDQEEEAKKEKIGGALLTKHVVVCDKETASRNLRPKMLLIYTHYIHTCAHACMHAGILWIWFNLRLWYSTIRA